MIGYYYWLQTEINKNGQNKSKLVQDTDNNDNNDSAVAGAYVTFIFILFILSIILFLFSIYMIVKCVQSKCIDFVGVVLIIIGFNIPFINLITFLIVIYLYFAKCRTNECNNNYF
jgi:hypothetical protein